MKHKKSSRYNKRLEHSRVRMLERFYNDLNEREREDVRLQIKHGKSRFIYRTSNSKSVHEVVIREKTLWVVWDKVSSSIVTIYPPKEEHATNIQGKNDTNSVA